MELIYSFLKWVLTVCVSVTTIAISVSGTIWLFNAVVLKLIEKILQQNKSYFFLYKYFLVRKPFHKWVDMKKEAGEDIMKPSLKELL